MNDRKDAYLIIAHKQSDLIHALISTLDFPKHDIYLHIDMKSPLSDTNFQNVLQYSNIFIFKSIDVQWGTASQVDVEMFLFEKAFKQSRSFGGYRYYHLLSGQDLPIKPIESVYHFFDDKEVEFLEFGANQEKHRFRMGQYQVYPDDTVLAKKYYTLRNTAMKVMGKDRLTKLHYQIYKGSNWASLTNSAVAFLIENKHAIYKTTRRTLCADEMYKHLWIMNATKRFPIWNHADIRYIDWVHYEGTSPHRLRIQDLDLLRKSPCLFARKFDMDIDREIVEYMVKENRWKKEQ